MNSKSLCSRAPSFSLPRACLRASPLAALFLCLAAFVTPASRAGDAPSWMHSLATAPLPDHDDKTDAVLLYSEDILTVQGNGKIKHLKRRVFKILRVGGKDTGTAVAYIDSETKILNMHGWCIPAQGKDYEVKEKDAIESSLPGVSNGELVSDLRAKILRIPASDPGNIVGYEIEQEERLFIFQDEWMFQSALPTREARFTLNLPAGWEYKAAWINYPEAKPASPSPNQWQWVVSDVKAIRAEDDMPPWKGVAGEMLLSLLPPGDSQKKGFLSWAEMGKWEADLAQGRRDSSPEIKQKVAELASSAPTTLAKMQALAAFVQHDIRYVAIELGIGGLQPHAARDIYTHRYGDCKDKATLLSAMLKEIGVDSYLFTVNSRRGGVNAASPAQIGWFNHEILAIRLPDDLKDPSLAAIVTPPKLGRLLIFDPTDEMTPFGQLSGSLQANYGLLVTPDGGELLQLPQLSPETSGVRRSGKLALSPNGTLSGEVQELRFGDTGAYQRYVLRAAAQDKDRIKPIETALSHSLASFQITKATIGNLHVQDQPFVYTYSFTADRYAKPAGTLLIVRPRVLGNKSSDILERKEPRKYPVEFDGPQKDIDVYEITLPAGYEVDELPPPSDADYSFASYHSKTEVQGNVLRYKRTYEIKELSVPTSKLNDLKALYRIIAGDERNTAVLKPASH
ncbi:MAG TPA: DUF3857 and transglutaminase domain-containing protein [Candidatus Acidoferrales bacterium]|jgi:hypothetical protein|nr:DUF3857 and transglutaminase domain-containing protein [Candidatus Acidoferrales bacterium]